MVYLNILSSIKSLFFLSGHMTVDRQAVLIRNTRAIVKINSVIFNTNFGRNELWLKGHEDNSFLQVSVTAQKMKFSIKDFFSKCDQIRSFLQIWSHLMKNH